MHPFRTTFAPGLRYRNTHFLRWEEPIARNLQSPFDQLRGSIILEALDIVLVNDLDFPSARQIRCQGVSHGLLS